MGHGIPCTAHHSALTFFHAEQHDHRQRPRGGGLPPRSDDDSEALSSDSSSEEADAPRILDPAQQVGRTLEFTRQQLLEMLSSDQQQR